MEELSDKNKPRRNLFSDFQIFFKAEDDLALKMAANTYYPFKKKSDSVYELVVFYHTFYAGLFLFLLSSSVFIGLTADKRFDTSWWPGSLIVICISIAIMNNYKYKRHYVLKPNVQEYEFAHTLPFQHERCTYYKGQYHNIYIRLRKENVDNRKRFYLVLNGYKLDSIRISKDGKHVTEMRKLGRKIAANLNLNYFDINNASEHHEIRHFRPIQKKK